MNCTELGRNSTLYFSHELDNEQSADFLSHLESCPSCAARVRQQQEIDHLLRSTVLAQEADTRALEFRIRRQLTERPKRGFVIPRQISLVAAAILVVCVLGFFSRQWIKSGRESAALCEDAVVDHRVEVVESAPRKWTTDVAKIGDFSTRVVGRQINPESLSPPGYHFQRARICALLDRRYLHLVYSNGSQEFSMFVGLNKKDTPSWWLTKPFHMESVSNTEVVQFHNGKLSFVLVGDASVSLMHLAEEVAGRS